jgi:hypothetical protein
MGWIMTLRPRGIWPLGKRQALRLAWGTTTDSLLSGVPIITNKQLFYPDPNDTQACAYDCAWYFDATDNYWYVGYTWQAPNYDFYVKISRTQDLLNAEHIFLDTSSPEPIEGARIYRTAGIVYFEGASKDVARWFLAKTGAVQGNYQQPIEVANQSAGTHPAIADVQINGQVKVVGVFFDSEWGEGQDEVVQLGRTV